MTHQEAQRIIHAYRAQTGKDEIDMHEVARWAHKTLGVRLPIPEDPLARLAKKLSKAAREETRRDARTGQPFRVNHAIRQTGAAGEQMTIWVNIDTAPRKAILKSLVQRREQMVGDGLQLSLDADHWNAMHPTEEPIALPLDFTDDVEWAKNAPNDTKKAG